VELFLDTVYNHHRYKH